MQAGGETFDSSRPPSGFVYDESVVREADLLWCTELQAWLASAAPPWEVATEGRRVAQFGYRYDYRKHCVDPTPVTPIPSLLHRLLDIAAQPQRRGIFTQCIINEYIESDITGIDGLFLHPHVFCKLGQITRKFWASLSLNSNCC
eukprot:SAG31_NODE_9606_length_1251_cov_2.528646_1_plen_145_part_00